MPRREPVDPAVDVVVAVDEADVPDLDAILQRAGLRALVRAFRADERGAVVRGDSERHCGQAGVVLIEIAEDGAWRRAG